MAARGGLIVEIIGTHFVLSLGAWRLRFVLAIEDNEEQPKEKVRPPHRLRVVPEDEYVR
ncbi:MAG TPA: hypothetical protein VFF63_05910 [Candidatus Babeliales bacterium]|nr:hypothetical protein [Candidatus Babeliales bacterium]